MDRLRLWLGVLPLPLLGVTLPGCSLICEPIYYGGHAYTLTARLVDRDSGRVESLSSTDMALSNGRRFEFCDSSGRESALRDWTRFIRARLEDPAAPEAFRALFAGGRWCLASADAREGEAVTIFAGRACEATTCPLESMGPDLERCAPDVAMPPPPGTCTIPGMPAGTPVLGLDRTVVDFGPLAVGSTTPLPGERVTVSNTGSGPLCVRLGLDTTARNAEDFSLDPNECRPASEWEMRERAVILSGTRTCGFFVRFQPSAGGPRTGAVRVNSNATPAETLVRLAGQGQPGGLRPSATALCFNVAGDPTGCRRRTVTFTNDGPGTVTVTSVATSMPPAWQVERVLPPGGPALPPAGVTLALSEVLTVDLLTCPSAAMRDGVLAVTSNASNGVIEVALQSPTSGCMP